MTTMEWVSVGMATIMAIAVGGTALLIAFRSEDS